MDSKRIYYRVLHIVEFFVKHAAGLSVIELQDYDPSLEELAQDIGALSKSLKALSTSFEDEIMAINALQCCFEMERLVKIVRSGDDDSELEAIFKRLERLTNVP